MNLPLPHDWRHRAACRDADPEIFFPVAEAGPALRRANAEALAYCRVCPVVHECRAFAFAHLPEGIAGGMTARQRAALKRHQFGRASGPTPDRHRPDPSPLAGRSGKGGQVRAVAIEQLIKGVPRDTIAREFGVCPRTVERWAARPEVRAHLPQTQAVG